MAAMDKLLKYFNAKRGRRSALAKALGRSPSAIYQWGQVPAELVLEVERITKISRSDLRPDLYPKRRSA